MRLLHVNSFFISGSFSIPDERKRKVRIILLIPVADNKSEIKRVYFRVSDQVATKGAATAAAEPVR